MIVDDALFMRQLLTKIFVDEGYEVCVEAGTARDAVEKYKEFKPDLVTMDIVMPMMEDLDGIGAVKEILKFDPRARVIVVSVMGEQSLVVEAIKAGAKDFVVKPVRPARLLDVVKGLLR
jgi:two-component system chemotaxis response regulator CheY